MSKTNRENKGVTLIAAIDDECGIGRDGDLLVQLKDDMKFFKSTTEDHVVIMGRKTWDSIPERFRPLSNRVNIVISNTLQQTTGENIVVGSIDEAIKTARLFSVNMSNGKEDKKIFVIGGGEIYKQFINTGLVEEMYITHIEETYGSDTFFPLEDALGHGRNFKQTKIMSCRLANEPDWSIIHYELVQIDDSNNIWDRIKRTIKRIWY